MIPGSDRSVSWGRIGVLVCLLFVIYAVSYYVFPAWIISLCLGLTAVVLAGALLSAVSPRTFGRLFGLTSRIPLWALVTIPVASVVAARAVVAYGPALFPPLFAVLLAGGSTYLLATGVSIVAGTTRPFDRHRVPLWVQATAAAAPFASGYALFRGVLTPTGFVLFVGLLLLTVYIWFVVPLAVYHRRVRQSVSEPLSTHPTASVIIPAYNEEGVISQNIESVLASEYPNDRLEVIVVDDGSTDTTYEQAAEYRDRGVQVYRKSNGGKHSALNFGLLCTSGDIVVTIDADSFVESDTITTAVSELAADPELGAVAGNVRVENDDRLLTRVQSIEYIFGISTLRETFSHFGVVSIVPGCFGAFRREAIEAVNGYSPDTVTEDFDMSIRLLRQGWVIKQSEAVVWTEAPFRWRDFYRQRIRWNVGTVQTLFKHPGMLTAYGSPTATYCGLVYLFRVVLQLFVPIIAPVLLLDVAVGALSGQADQILSAAAFFLILSTVLVSLTIELDARDGRLAVYSLPFLGYKLIISYLSLYSNCKHIVGDTVEWRKIQRTKQVD